MLSKIREWIYNEMKRNGQVYFVHDRVESIDKLADYLNKHIPDIKIGIAHGQMKSSQLEEVIHGFLSRKYDVLLSTKIIESGLDIPNVNTIIINQSRQIWTCRTSSIAWKSWKINTTSICIFYCSIVERNYKESNAKTSGN
ncbi:MAG: hypothetical protein MZV64_05460 [Ignavibacteriales bacterium]|nr:hypothetical protein [Ignavibacteriales bacterium]